MSTYPDFDADWRNHDAAARATETILQEHVNNLENHSAAAIQDAVKEFISQHSNCQKLSERVNAKYKGLKREHFALEEKANAAEKLKEEKKHAVIKAKEYRARIKILEKKVKDLDGKIDDVKTPDVEYRKRGIDQVNTEDDPKQQPQKRCKRTGMALESTSEERSKTPDIPLSQRKKAVPQPPTPSPSSLSTSSRRTASPVHMTPIRRAKSSNFKNGIPFGMEKKFAATRNTIPNKLHDATQRSSHVTAVMQGLAATMKAHEAYFDLSKGAKEAPDFRLLRNDLTMLEIEEEIWKAKDIPASKAFVDFIADTQHPQSRALSTYPLQRHLEHQRSASPRLTEPIKYAEQVLRTVNTLYIENAFKTSNTYQLYCAHCNSIQTYGDNEFDYNSDKSSFNPSTTITGDEWITILKPNFTDREFRYGKPAVRNLDTLREKLSTPSLFHCPTCKRHNTGNRQKHWKGFSYSPSVLTFSFDRQPASSTNKVYKLTLPIEQDLTGFVCASSQQIKYRLVTVIKKLKIEMYAAFVHTEDGKWWRCINESVKECGIEEWQSDERNGECVMAMYERLDD